MAACRPSPRRLKASTVEEDQQARLERQRAAPRTAAPAHRSACCPSSASAAGCPGPGSSAPIRPGSRCRSTSVVATISGAGRVGQDVAAQDARRAGAQGSRGAHEVALRRREHAGPRPAVRASSSRTAPRSARCAHTLAASPDARRQAELAEVDRGQHDQERQQRQADHGIGEAHQERIDAPAGIARDQPDQRADRGRQQRADTPTASETWPPRAGAAARRGRVRRCPADGPCSTAPVSPADRRWCHRHPEPPRPAAQQQPLVPATAAAAKLPQLPGRPTARLACEAAPKVSGAMAYP